MFLIALCILLWALFAYHASFDQFGWLMLVATGWFSGFMDAKLHGKRDKDPKHCIPQDSENDAGNDATLFHD